MEHLINIAINLKSVNALHSKSDNIGTMLCDKTTDHRPLTNQSPTKCTDY